MTSYEKKIKTLKEIKNTTANNNLDFFKNRTAELIDSNKIGGNI